MGPKANLRVTAIRHRVAQIGVEADGRLAFCEEFVSHGGCHRAGETPPALLKWRVNGAHGSTAPQATSNSRHCDGLTIDHPEQISSSAGRTFHMGWIRRRIVGDCLLVKGNEPFSQQWNVSGARSAHRALDTGIARRVCEHMNALWDRGLKLPAHRDRVLDKPMGGLIGAHNAWGANCHRHLCELPALSSIEISEQDRPSRPLHRAMARCSQRPKTEV